METPEKVVISKMYDVGRYLGKLLLESTDSYLLQALGVAETPEKLEIFKKWMDEIGAVPPTEVYALIRDYLHREAVPSGIYESIHKLTIRILNLLGYDVKSVDKDAIHELVSFESAILSQLTDYNPKNPHPEILRKAINAGREESRKTEILDENKIRGFTADANCLLWGIDSITTFKTHDDETVKKVLKDVKKLLEQYRSYLETLFKHRYLFI